MDFRFSINTLPLSDSSHRESLDPSLNVPLILEAVSGMHRYSPCERSMEEVDFTPLLKRRTLSARRDRHCMQRIKVRGGSQNPSAIPGLSLAFEPCDSEPFSRHR